MKAKDLIQDDKNFNKGTSKGKELMDKSLSRFGAGRSILIDKNNKVIAGNKTLDAFKGQEVEIVESDGTKLIAVKHIDIDLDTPEGRELALADNQTSKVNFYLLIYIFHQEHLSCGITQQVLEQLFAILIQLVVVQVL